MNDYKVVIGAVRPRTTRLLRLKLHFISCFCVGINRYNVLKFFFFIEFLGGLSCFATIPDAPFELPQLMPTWNAETDIFYLCHSSSNRCVARIPLLKEGSSSRKHCGAWMKYQKLPEFEEFLGWWLHGGARMGSLNHRDLWSRLQEVDTRRDWLLKNSATL